MKSRKLTRSGSYSVYADSFDHRRNSRSRALRGGLVEIFEFVSNAFGRARTNNRSQAASAQSPRAGGEIQTSRRPTLGLYRDRDARSGVIARAAVNDVMDSILAREDEPISAKTVSDLIGDGMKRVKQLETEDRDRTADYMMEIWYLLGFKGATGRFAFGAAFQRPEGYGEPLPPGWKSPTEPREIGRS